MSTKKKQPKEEVKRLVNFKTTAAERDKLKRLASAHPVARGVVSDYIRIVALSGKMPRKPRPSRAA